MSDIKWTVCYINLINTTFIQRFIITGANLLHDQKILFNFYCELYFKPDKNSWTHSSLVLLLGAHRGRGGEGGKELSNQIIINYKVKDTVCPRSSDPFYVKTYYIYSIVYSDPFYVETYYIKWVILGHSSIQLNF